LNNATTIGGAGDLVIGSPVTGAGGLTKVGNGKLILGAANSYIGTTTVNAGTLLVNGSITGSATVNAGTLGGTGSISSVEVLPGATLRGGDGVSASGGLTSSNVLILDDGATIALTLGTGGTHSSLISAAGFFAFDQTAQGFIFNSGASAGFYDNIIVGLTGSEPGLDDIAHWAALNPEYAGSTFIYDGLGNVDLNLTAVPEPATTLTILSGLGLLLAFRRRSRV
jgi:autotransporter-associated beta strand protein